MERPSRHRQPPRQRLSLEIDAQLWRIVGEIADEEELTYRKIVEQSLVMWLRQHGEESYARFRTDVREG